MKRVKTWSLRAAALEMARNPEVASVTSVREIFRTTHEPSFWSTFLVAEK